MEKKTVVNLVIGSAVAVIGAGIGYAVYKKKKINKDIDDFLERAELEVSSEPSIEAFDNVHYIPLGSHESENEESVKTR